MNIEKIFQRSEIHPCNVRKQEKLNPGLNTEDFVTIRNEKTKSLVSLEIMKKVCRGENSLSNAHVQDRAKKLLEKKKEGIKEEVLVNVDRHMHIITHGVPSYVKLFDHKGVVFRHYFREEAQKENALSLNALIAGPVSYAQVSPCLRIDFPDLTGVFLTLPSVKPEEVGVPGHNVYLDLTLPDDTPVLEIEPGKIYLVPGEPKLQDWIVEYYNRYKNGENIPEYMLPTMKKIDEKGGIPEYTKVYFYTTSK